MIEGHIGVDLAPCRPARVVARWPYSGRSQQILVALGYSDHGTFLVRRRGQSRGACQRRNAGAAVPCDWGAGNTLPMPVTMNTAAQCRFRHVGRVPPSVFGWVGRVALCHTGRSFVWEVAYAAADDEETGHRDLRGRTGRRDGPEQPVCLADPEVNPDPAAIDAPPVEQPLLPPPPEAVAAATGAIRVHPAAAAPVDPLAPPPPVDPLAPPPVDPLAANPVAPQPTVIPEGTPAGQDPTPYTGRAGLRAADLQPAQRVDGGRGQADLHQLRAAHRQPAAGAGSRAHLVGPAGARQVLLGQRHASCGGARSTSGLRTPSSTSTPAAPSPASAPETRWSPPSTTPRTR